MEYKKREKEENLEIVIGEQKRMRVEQYQDMIGRLHSVIAGHTDIFSKPVKEVEISGKKFMAKTVTWKVTDDCNLNCSYCYQTNKCKKSMSFETAKKLVDLLLNNDPLISNYINIEESPAIIIEFIGGEPFMEIELIDKIVDYFKVQAYLKNHPYATLHCISICSNGVLYRDPRVQRFLQKNRSNMSFSITIDGNKELHDSCRLFHDGRPSYDICMEAVKDWTSKGGYMGSKITIAPENITYLYDAIIHMVDNNYHEINANVVYEKGWELKHAKIYYEQLKKIADYFVDNDLVMDVYCALFEDNYFRPKHKDDNDNWCFKAGTKITYPNSEYMDIENCKVGEVVIDMHGNEEKIIRINKRLAEETSILYTSIKEGEIGSITYTTPEHPYLSIKLKNPKSLFINERYNEKAEWVKVKDLNPGDVLIQPVKIEIGDDTYTEYRWVFVEKIEVGEPYEVFNLEVENSHTFIADGIVVHNCGGNGLMLAMDTEGKLFPCIRYMDTSLGSNLEPYSIGDVNIGIGREEKHKERISCLDCITRRSQSNDKCFDCKIAEGCSWCTALHYQENGTPNSRVTHICVMHQARALANSYFWNKFYIKTDRKERHFLHIPENWALDIIDTEELEMLKSLAELPDDSYIIKNATPEIHRG